MEERTPRSRIILEVEKFLKCPDLSQGFRWAGSIAVEEDVKPDEDVVQKADGYDGSASLRCKILKREKICQLSDFTVKPPNNIQIVATS